MKNYMGQPEFYIETIELNGQILRTYYPNKTEVRAELSRMQYQQSVHVYRWQCGYPMSDCERICEVF